MFNIYGTIRLFINNREKEVIHHCLQFYLTMSCALFRNFDFGKQDVHFALVTVGHMKSVQNCTCFIFCAFPVVTHPRRFKSG